MSYELTSQHVAIRLKGQVMKLLHIDSSILGEQSASRRLTDEIVSSL